MKELKDVFLEFVRELAEGLAGSFNLGVNTASSYNDRLDFLLAYLLVSFNASYRMHEFSLHQVNYEKYVRMLAEKEKQTLEFEEKEEVYLAEEGDENLDSLEAEQEQTAPEEKAQVETVITSLDEAQAANPIVITQIAATLAVTTLAKVVSEASSTTTTTTTNNEEYDEPAASDTRLEIFTSIFDEVSRLASGDLSEDSGPIVVNFYTVAAALGLDPASQEIQDIYNGLFSPGNSIFIPPVCTFVEAVFYRDEADLDGDGLIDRRAGDIVFTPVPFAQTLGDGEVGIELYTLDVGYLGGGEVIVEVGVPGINDAPVPLPQPPLNLNDNSDIVIIPFANILELTTDAEGDPLQIIGVPITGDPSNGASIVGASLVIDPTEYDFLAEGDSGATIQLNFTVSDGTAEVITTQLINIAGSNDSPVAVLDVVAGAENQIFNINVLGNDTDVDRNDNPTNFSLDLISFPVVISSPVLVGPGTASLVGNQITFDPGLAFDSLASSEQAIVTINYTMSDDSGFPLSSSSVVRITINGMNDSPIALPDTGLVITGDNSLTVDVLANDTDIDHNDLPVNFSLDLVNVGSVTTTSAAVLGTGSVSIDRSNRLLFNPGADFNALVVGETATVVLNYTMSDDEGALSNSTATITINGVNDNPISAPFTATAITEDTVNPATVALLTGASDPDAGDDLDTASVGVISSNPARVVVFTVDNNTGILSFNPNQFNDLAATDSETLTISYDIIDNNGGVTPNTAMITINGVNDIPISAPFTATAITEDTPNPATVALLTGASDPDAGDILNTANVGIVSSNPARVVAFNVDNSTGILSFNPDQFNDLTATDSETLTISYNIIDNNGGVTPNTVMITINGVNDAPTVSDDLLVNHLPEIDRDDDTSYAFTAADFTDTFSDEDNGDSLQGIRIQSFPSIGTLSFSGGPITLGALIPIAMLDDIIHTASAEEFGAVTFTYDAQDQNGEFSNIATGTITIYNDPPYVEWPFLGTPETTLPRFLVDDLLFDDPFDNTRLSAVPLPGLADEVDINQYVRDVENLDLTYSYTNLPSWLDVSDSGISTGNILTDNGSRSAFPFLGLGTVATVGLTVGDSISPAGGILSTSFEILNYRLDFDVGNAMNNAEGSLNGAGSISSISSGYFGASHLTSPGLGSSSTIYLLNSPGDDLLPISEFMGWQINGLSEYQLDVTGVAGTTSVIFEDIPLTTSTSDVQIINLRVGVNAPLPGVRVNDLNTSAYTIGLASDSDDFGDMIIGDLVNNPDIIYGFDGNDDIFGDTEENLSAVGGIGGNQLIFGGDGDDNLAGDFYGSLTLNDALYAIGSGQRSGNDIIYGGEGHDWIAGDSFYEGTIAIQVGGEAGSDIIYGGNGMNVIWGDTRGGISGVAGNDWIEGGDDSDVIYGDTEGDISGVAGNDFLSGGAGNDEIYSDTSGSTIAIKGVDTIVGGPGDDTLYGAGFASGFAAGGIFPFVSNVFRYDLTIDNGSDTIERMISSVSGPSLSEARAIIELTNALDTTLDTLAEVLDFSIIDTDGAYYEASITDAGVGADSTISFAASSFLPTNNPVLPIRLIDTSGVEVIYNVALLDDTANGTVEDPYVLATQPFPNDAAYLFGGDDYAVGDDPEGTTFGAQLISGGDGNDTIFGDTNGILNSTAGEDYINGGGGNDNLYGDGFAFGASAVRANNTFAYSLVSDNGDDTIFDFNFRNDGLAGEDTILITDATGSLIQNLADIIEFPSNLLTLNDTADGGVGSTKGTISFDGAGGGIKEYSFAIQDIFGFEESYNVIVGTDDPVTPGDTLLDSVSLDRDIFVGLQGADRFEFDYGSNPETLGTNVILDYDASESDEVFFFFGFPAPGEFIEDYTEVMDSGVDLNDDGTNDIKAVVTNPFDGTEIGGEYIFAGINYTGDTELIDYSITASTVTA